jgi:hypothetical protein
MWQSEIQYTEEGGVSIKKRLYIYIYIYNFAYLFFLISCAMVSIFLSQFYKMN